MKCVPTKPQRQRGVALIIALVLVALATILAVKIGFDGYVERRRAITMLAAEQAFQFGMGAEALAADILARSIGASGEANLAQPWAQVTSPIPLRPPNDPEGEPMGSLEGYLEDQSGRFNINNLRHTLPPDGRPDPQPFDQFTRILVAVGLEPKWAAVARDWITDSQVVSPDGAKDGVYSRQTPPYLTANWPMLSTSELLSMPEFGAERYRKLAPYITALPTDHSKINRCTAPGLVLDSLKEDDRTFTGDPPALVNGRKSGCFPDAVAFDHTGHLPRGVVSTDVVSEQSDYFRLTTRVTLGTTEFTLYSLLQRMPSTNSNGHASFIPLLRSFGTY